MTGNRLLARTWSHGSQPASSNTDNSCGDGIAHRQLQPSPGGETAETFGDLTSSIPQERAASCDAKTVARAAAFVESEEREKKRRERRDSNPRFTPSIQLRRRSKLPTEPIRDPLLP
jgi:hypothetical protein